MAPDLVTVGNLFFTGPGNAVYYGQSTLYSTAISTSSSAGYITFAVPEPTSLCLGGVAGVALVGAWYRGRGGRPPRSPEARG